MWNPDKAPVLGFDKLARRVGLAKARAIFAAYREKLRIDNAIATEQEKAAAAQRHKRGPIVVRNDFEFYPLFHAAPITVKQITRSECEKGQFVGDRNLWDDSERKKLFKKYPELAPQKIVTGDIRGGWTPALEQAAKEGRMHRALQMAKASLKLQQAAQEGRAALVA
jgi:hypothetical protein